MIFEVKIIANHDFKRVVAHRFYRDEARAYAWGESALQSAREAEEDWAFGYVLSVEKFHFAD